MFNIFDTSFSVTSSIYKALVLLFFMYDIGYVWFCGMFVARLEHVTCNMYITIIKTFAYLFLF